MAAAAGGGPGRREEVAGGGRPARRRGGVQRLRAGEPVVGTAAAAGGGGRGGGGGDAAGEEAAPGQAVPGGAPPARGGAGGGRGGGGDASGGSHRRPAEGGRAGAEGSAAAPGRQRREVESGKRLCVVPGGKKGTEERHMGHASHVLCMAISSDGKYLATGDRNKLIMVWDTATCKRLHIFTGHRDAVSGLSFRKGTHQLYSASHDRCVKVWNVAENADMETLFGHQDVITGLDSLSRECCVTAGGRDGTVRLWKIPEESQLVFYGHQGSIDCIQLINEEHMVSGADDGSVALWGLAKKKPLALARQAHGMQDAQGVQQPYWISAVAALRNSDLLATGSHSANVKLWKCSEGFRKLEPLWAIPLVGFVNSLEFSAAGDFLVAGLGQEHRYRPPSPALAGGTASTASRARWRVTPISLICRLGRWWRIKEAKNSICIIPLKRRATAPSSHVPDSS
ncbi:U3 small nucleolar RNA-interacting protein 2-like isoform X4 [Phalacrocorax aristotelis]|uniref:U3 small nucleolar RNA-interacting protein 2-like isoform X4 n=1 Tax=Phalacrocorax aristotelis TaxID=126867 RepID=UPI003F4C8567